MKRADLVVPSAAFLNSGRTEMRLWGVLGMCCLSLCEMCVVFM